MANTIGWGKATQNNTNGFGKYQNTIGAASVYAVSAAGETVIEGTSASFLYSKSSYHQDEADPTPTITGTTGGSFNASAGLVFVDTGTHNSSTGQIDLSASTIDSHIITYTVNGVQSGQTIGITASPFVTNTYSMQFDGVDDYVDCGDSDTFSFGNGSSDFPFTVSAWVYAEGSSSFPVFDKYPDSGSWSLREYRMLEVNSSNQVFCVLYDSSAGARFDIYSDSTITRNQWQHISITYDGRGGSSASDGVKIYINGVESNKTVNAFGTYVAMENKSTPVRIGRVGSAYADGKIDEVAIWNTALSSDAVTEIYNATANNTGKVLDLNTDTGNYTSSSNLTYWNRLGD